MSTKPRKKQPSQSRGSDENADNSPDNTREKGGSEKSKTTKPREPRDSTEQREKLEAQLITLEDKISDAESKLNTLKAKKIILENKIKKF